MEDTLTVKQLISFLKKHDENLFVQLDFDGSSLNIRGSDYTGERFLKEIDLINLPTEYEYRSNDN